MMTNMQPADFVDQIVPSNGFQCRLQNIYLKQTFMQFKTQLENHTKYYFFQIKWMQFKKNHLTIYIEEIWSNKLLGNSRIYYKNGWLLNKCNNIKVLLCY